MIEKDFVAPRPNVFRRIPVIIRSGFIAGGLVGLVGSFILLLKGPGGAHIPAIVIFPFVGPIVGLLGAVIGATVGAIGTLGGNYSRKQKARRVGGLLFICLILCAAVAYVGQTGISVADMLSPKSFIALLIFGSAIATAILWICS